LDTFVLRILQGEVQFQCRAVLDAGGRLQQAVPTRDVEMVFVALQGVLVASANLSKLLWGSGGRRDAERIRLRESLAVADDSPLRDPQLRNDFEHFDERVELWFETSTNRNYIGRYVGPYGGIVGPATGDRFQHFDPVTGEATFWDHSVNVAVIFKEVLRILPLAQAESHKPHWDPPQKSAE
jgi:hypothetical protein